MSFINELKRRNVFRVGIAYVIVAWLVVQVSDVMIDNIGAPEWLFKFILLVLAVGFPVTLVVAWAFELTPEGLKREKEVDRSQSITPKTGRKLDFTIIGVLVVALSYFIYESRFTEKGLEVTAAVETEQVDEPTQPETAAKNSVAVLPFVNMSNDADNEYFSDGLTETLLHMLAQIPDLQVAARTSSFAFKGKNEAIKDVARALGVAHVLEGSVQKAGGQVRITAQLIRADDGFHMWSQNYTRPLDDIFAIQDEIASDVASALGASLLGSGESQMRGVATENLGAYDSYLRGLKEQATFSYTSLDEAEKHFKRALLEDPDFADARLALARNYFLKAGTGVITGGGRQTQVTPLLNDVLQDDPDNYIAQAYDLLNRMPISESGLTQAQLHERVDELRELFAHIPTDAYLRTTLAWFYSGPLDDPAQALELLQAGLLIDPLDADIYISLGWVYSGLREADNAVAALKRAAEMSPDNPNTYYNLSILEAEAGNMKGYFEGIKKAMDIDPQDHELAANLAATLYSLDLSEEAERWYRRVQALSPASPTARSLSVYRAYARQQSEEVIRLVEQNVRDQIENRNAAFFFSLMVYSDVMMQQNRSREAYDFLLSVRPEITNFDQQPSDTQGSIMQTFSVLLMFGFASHQDVLTAWDRYSAMKNAQGYKWILEDSDLKTIDLLVHGDREGAVDQFVNIRLNTPLADNLNAHKMLLPDIYQGLADDPVVAAKLAERSREFMALRAEISNMMQESEWQ